MADTVNTVVVHEDADHYVVQLQNVSDGTGESAIAKVDKSTLEIEGQNPAIAVGHLAIEEIAWNIQGFSYVVLLFDHTANDQALLLAGNSYLDFREYGGLHDPQSAGGTGDLLLTTAGAVNGATYNITAVLRKHK